MRSGRPSKPDHDEHPTRRSQVGKTSQCRAEVRQMVNRRDGCHDVERAAEIMRHHVITHPYDARMLDRRASEDAAVKVDRNDVRDHASKLRCEHPVARSDIEGRACTQRDCVEHDAMHVDVVVPPWSLVTAHSSIIAGRAADARSMKCPEKALTPTVGSRSRWRRTRGFHANWQQFRQQDSARNGRSLHKSRKST